MQKLPGNPDQSDRYKVSGFLVASPAEADTGMIYDLVYDLRRRYLADRIREVIPFLYLKPMTDSPMESQDNSLNGNMNSAFFRELHRFMKGGTQVLDHGNLGLQSFDRILFDRVFVYDHHQTLDVSLSKSSACSNAARPTA